MPSIIPEIRQEHRVIEHDLNELDLIRRSLPINYPNLIHVFKRLTEFWDLHEKKEERFFKALKSKHSDIPYEKIVFEHGELHKYREHIKKALQSGSEEQVRHALDTSGKALISELHEHMERENEMLTHLPKDSQRLAF